jgi:hypothetical protein
MAWARLDDGFHDHPKLIGLPLEAVGLWTLSLTWAHRHHGLSFGLVGHIPPDLPQRLAGSRGKKLAAMLQQHQLWDAEPNIGGWVIHDYVDYLPASEKPSTASEVRKARSEAGKAGAKARWSDSNPETTTSQDDGKLLSESDSKRNGKPMPPNPTRPEPDPLTHFDREGGSSVTREQRPPDHCHKHPSGWTDPCAACGTAKRARADWDTTDARQRKTQDTERRRADNAIRLRAIGACGLCDDHGYRLLKSGDGIGGVCDHVARAPNPLERAKAAIQGAP